MTCAPSARSSSCLPGDAVVPSRSILSGCSRRIRLSALARKMARPVALDVEPASVRERPRGENPHAFASFSLALLVWALLAAAWLAEPLQHGFPVWIPLMASLALMLGVVLGLQGAGRASAGAGRMPY